MKFMLEMHEEEGHSKLTLDVSEDGVFLEVEDPHVSAAGALFELDAEKAHQLVSALLQAYPGEVAG